MSFRDRASDPTPVPSGTLTELLLDTVARLGPEPALRSTTDGADWASLTYDEVAVSVGEVAVALRALGCQRGDRVAILSENRPEWAIADYGCLAAGIQDVPIYATLTAAQIAYIMEDSRAKLVFVSGGPLHRTAREAIALLDRDVILVHFAPPPAGGGPHSDVEPGPAVPPGEGEGNRELSWEECLELGRIEFEGLGPDTWREEALRARPEDVATLIYTSGTTGDPKGVMLTHNNLFTNVTAAGMRLEITVRDDTLSFLPLCHSFQRMVDYLLFSVGCTIAYARSMDTVAEDMRSVRPSVVVSVPRLYEKVYQRVTAATGLRGRLVKWARGVGLSWARAKLEGPPPGPLARISHAIADRLVFSKVRDAVGGRLRFFVSGGAPLEPELAYFFYGAGIRILEGYGLTETSPVTNVNTLTEQRVGTVGKPIPSTEIAIAEDGEILVRGPQVMKGYLGREEETRAVIDPDGWFHTGDIGEIVEDGYLRITDRKKSLFKTSGGKYIAPAPIENRVKTSRYVEHAMVVGEARKFPALLIVPEFSQLSRWASARGLAGDTHEELLSSPEVRRLIVDEVGGLTEGLAHYERPKKIGVLLDELTIEDGSVTPTQKIKRKVVLERYRPLVDALYDAAHVSEDLVVQSR